MRQPVKIQDSHYAGNFKIESFKCAHWDCDVCGRVEKFFGHSDCFLRIFLFKILNKRLFLLLKYARSLKINIEMPYCSSNSALRKAFKTQTS